MQYFVQKSLFKKVVKSVLICGIFTLGVSQFAKAFGDNNDPVVGPQPTPHTAPSIPSPTPVPVPTPAPTPTPTPVTGGIR